MKLTKILKTTAIVSCLASGAAHAVSVDFDVDGSTSSASASVTGCILCIADITAATVSGLDATAFSLDVGQSSSFDFVEFTASGFGGGFYEVAATLAFSTPGGAVSSNGGGVFGTFFGAISSGTLTWNNAIQQVSLTDGTVYTVALEDGFTIGLGSSAISQATVTLDVAVVPIPATALLLASGMAGLGLAGRRQRRMINAS